MKSKISWEKELSEPLSVYQELWLQEMKQKRRVFNYLYHRCPHSYRKRLKQCVPYLCPHPLSMCSQGKGYQTILGRNLCFRKASRNLTFIINISTINIFLILWFIIFPPLCNHGSQKSLFPFSSLNYTSPGTSIYC